MLWADFRPHWCHVLACSLLLPLPPLPPPPPWQPPLAPPLLPPLLLQAAHAAAAGFAVPALGSSEGRQWFFAVSGRQPSPQNCSHAANAAVHRHVLPPMPPYPGQHWCSPSLQHAAPLGGHLAARLRCHGDAPALPQLLQIFLKVAFVVYGQ